MTSKKTKTNESFRYTPTTKLPALSHIKTEWDLEALYYKDENDPKIEADLKAAEKAFITFAKKWRKRPFTTEVSDLVTSLTEFETLTGMPEISRPGRYFSFRSTLNTNDTVAEKQLALIARRLRKASDHILFFTLALGKISKQEQRNFLRHKDLEHFNYYLKRLFLGARYHLSEAEEKIISLKGRQSYTLWVDMVEKIISNRTVTYRGKKIHLPEALETINILKSDEKPKLWKLIIDQMEQIGEVAEHEFNAFVTDVRTEDELRGYQKPYSATALNYEDSEMSIESLVKAVSTNGFQLSQKFYKLKALYQGVSTIDYSQKYDSIGKPPQISFAKSVEICRDVFYGLKTEYGQIFDQLLSCGQIDAFPKQGKHGGAFMSGEVNQPTQVMLNHLNNFTSLETMAHEMGHAIHTMRSKTQTPLYEGHSIVTAETASTLFENLVFDAVYAQASEAEQIVLLHDRITHDISTIERQIAFFNAELEIHTTIYQKGAMTNDELRGVMQRHLTSYLGSAVKVTPRDGFSYVYISHLRYGFYVYTYSFGLLMSTSMAKHYKDDHRYIEKIDQFLSLGSAAKVSDIFSAIGIKTTETDTFTEALKHQAADIATFGRFVKKQNRKASS